MAKLRREYFHNVIIITGKLNVDFRIPLKRDNPLNFSIKARFSHNIPEVSISKKLK